jgi:cytochrome c oxidase subunit 3
MVTAGENEKQVRRIHPQKFALWLGIGSIIMMFGGFTSGYIVRKGQGNWINYDLPASFYVSTLAVIISSVTIAIAVRSFKQRNMALHKKMVVASLLLGVLFTILQYVGFNQLYHQLRWNNNVSLQFLAVIVSVHALHIIGGVIALLILFVRTFSRRVKTYSPTGLEIIATYWHFVDILWIYLFIFFLVNQ